MTYHSLGKQVLHGRDHVADARDSDMAATIALALNDQHVTHCPVMPEMRNVDHAVRQENDEYACACGMRWDVGEGEEHP